MPTALLSISKSVSTRYEEGCEHITETEDADEVEADTPLHL
jgi:hypothetical protein